MAKRMLIDATHPEETRVVALNGNRLEEFDFETESKKQLKGNIYLAKVTRVEPSLQAAFVEYGGNRHGFLPFSEIHPDYYRIPVSDREAMLAQQRQEAGEAENGDGHDDAVDATTGTAIETVGGDEMEDVARRQPRPLHSYKIQEVIKRKQVLLVQVAKEERGTKGAALTTFISLAGRYTVLMPNNATGGGVSRKITNVKARKRLKQILEDLAIPDGMSLILRTAGLERTKAEIKRDYEYLLRLWDSIRELTLKSVAPTLIYEEANLVKRAIRDLYTRDIDEVLVEGEEGYRTAKDFMRMLMPSHAKKVQPYRDATIPLFHRYQVEQQIESLLNPTVALKSGGSIVLNPTEALVAIDVNSGKATKERHIEETALRTNLEAAEEIARQLRLRDLAGLIVIDFIDMETEKNNNAVEKRLKDAMKTDRARVQLGKISPFGLLELSRQRLRPSLMEISFEPSPDCGGTGYIRTVESSALHVLRGVEEEGIRRRSAEVTVHVPGEVALYILNQKRSSLAAIEERYNFRVLVERDDSLYRPSFRLDRVRTRTEAAPGRSDAQPLNMESEAVLDREPIAEVPDGGQRDRADSRDEAARDTSKRRRSRTPAKRRRGEEPATREAAAAASEAEPAAAVGEPSRSAAARTGESADSAASKARRRRGKRGGRRRARREDGSAAADTESAQSEQAGDAPAEDSSVADAQPGVAMADTASPEGAAAAPAQAAAAEPATAEAGATAPAATAADDGGAATAEAASQADTEDAGPGKARTRRRGTRTRRRTKTAASGDGNEAAPNAEAPAAPVSGEEAAAAPAPTDTDAAAAPDAHVAVPAAEPAMATAATSQGGGDDDSRAARASVEAASQPAAEPAGQPATEPAGHDAASTASAGEPAPGGGEAVNVPQPTPVEQAPRRRRSGWWRRTGG